jgi:hypothetical protein
MAEKENRKGASGTSRSEPPERVVTREFVPKVQEVPHKAFERDPVFYRIAVGALAAVVILALCGIFALAWSGKPASESLTALASVSVGALAGLFIGSHSKG